MWKLDVWENLPGLLTVTSCHLSGSDPSGMLMWSSLKQEHYYWSTCHPWRRVQWNLDFLRCCWSGRKNMRWLANMRCTLQKNQFTVYCKVCTVYCGTTVNAGRIFPGAKLMWVETVYYSYYEDIEERRLREVTDTWERRRGMEKVSGSSVATRHRFWYQTGTIRAKHNWRIRNKTWFGILSLKTIYCKVSFLKSGNTVRSRRKKHLTQKVWKGRKGRSRGGGGDIERLVGSNFAKWKVKNCGQLRKGRGGGGGGGKGRGKKEGYVKGTHINQKKRTGKCTLYIPLFSHFFCAEADFYLKKDIWSPSLTRSQEDKKKSTWSTRKSTYS